MRTPGTEHFLTDDDIEELGLLSPFPEFFDGVRGVEDSDWCNRFKYPYANPGATWAIAAEDLLEFSGGPLRETADSPRVTASYARPWAPRGQGMVPIIQGIAISILDVVVPNGFKWWIDGYAFGLFPSQANELNYYWMVRVDGRDILNVGPNTLQPGRPIQSPVKVPIGYTKDEMFLVEPGSRVEVVVQALNTLGASDSVSATLFGELEGIEA